MKIRFFDGFLLLLDPLQRDSTVRALHSLLGAPPCISPLEHFAPMVVKITKLCLADKDVPEGLKKLRFESI